MPIVTCSSSLFANTQLRMPSEENKVSTFASVVVLHDTDVDMLVSEF